MVRKSLCLPASRHDARLALVPLPLGLVQQGAPGPSVSGASLVSLCPGRWYHRIINLSSSVSLLWLLVLEGSSMSADPAAACSESIHLDLRASSVGRLMLHAMTQPLPQLLSLNDHRLPIATHLIQFHW